ncbi:MAG: hypothetical protein ACOYPR_23440, partial [Saprospiraceae bacterium]
TIFAGKNRRNRVAGLIRLVGMLNQEMILESMPNLFRNLRPGYFRPGCFAFFRQKHPISTVKFGLFG